MPIKTEILESAIALARKDMKVQQGDVDRIVQEYNPARLYLNPKYEKMLSAPVEIIWHPGILGWMVGVEP